MRLHCIRHAVTELNRRGIFSTLGEEGIEEEQRMALESMSFRIDEFDAVHCSPATRCRETAAALGIVDYVEEPRLLERDFGVFNGLTVARCMERFPEALEAFRRLDGEFVIPGGESRAQHLSRLLDWLEAVADLDSVLAITHGGTIDFLHRMGTGHPLHGGDTVFAGANAAVSVFDVEWPDVSTVQHGVPLEDYRPVDMR